MKAEVQLKIKMENGVEVILNVEEAKELFFKLKEIFEEKTEFIPYPTYPVYPTYPTYPWIRSREWWEAPVWYTTTAGNVTIDRSGDSTVGDSVKITS